MSNPINKNIISGVYENTDDLKNQVVEINKTLDDLLKKQSDLKTAGEKNSKTYQDVAAQIRLAKDAIKDTNTQIDANVKALNTSKNSLEQNRGLLQALQAQYEQLTKSQGDNSKGAQELNLQIGTLNNVITQQEEKLQKSRKVFDAHGETSKALSSAFDTLKGSAGNFAPALDDAAKGFNALKSGLTVVKTGFLSVGGAIKTTGFGLLVLVLQSIVEYFTNTADGAKKFKKILVTIEAVVNVFKQGFADFGRILINAFEHPTESIKKLGNLLVENIFNRFKAILVIWDGIKNMDFKKISNGVLQAATGVTNVVEKAATAYNNITEAIKKNEAEQEKQQTKPKGIAKPGNSKSTTKKQPRGADLLEAQSVTFAKQIELDKQHYDTELALLNEQLSKKLISQDDYNKQAEQLQEKFHLAIGDKVQLFNKNDFAEAKKHMQDMIDAHEHDDVMANDKKKVDKAIFPGQKQKAEKQLITDKYNYEIMLAAGNADKIKELENQKQQDITDINKKYEQQRKDFALQTAQKVSDTAFSLIQKSIQSQSEAKIKGLEKDKAAELSNKSLTNTQRQAIEAKYQKQEAAEKIKAFKSEQRASILQAVINGALAITKATSQAGVISPLVVPTIIASTAIQVATIAAQKPPQYAKGGMYKSDGRGAVLSGYSRTDDTNAYLRSGEAVVVSEAMRNPWARNLVSAINVAHGGRDFSVPNTSRGYAIGGIFTDGGNANRYYNQPVNDAKDLANTLAYQMINNFPPVYVDVKDINNQQNILAQTVNRVNL